PDGPGDLDGPDGGIGPDGIGPATAALQPTLVPHCPDPTTDQPEWTTEVVAVADLEITKEAPPFVTLGDEFDYRITVVNHGPSTATDVVVVDTLPAGMTYIRDSVGAINDGSGTLTWELGDMAAGEERVIILTVDTEV